MPDLVVPYNTQNRVYTFTIIDGNTGTVMDLTGLTVTLKINTTDYLTSLLSKVLTNNAPTTGIATWTPVSGDWASFTNINQAYYGQIIMTAAGKNIATMDFDFKLIKELA